MTNYRKGIKNDTVWMNEDHWLHGHGDRDEKDVLTDLDGKRYVLMRDGVNAVDVPVYVLNDYRNNQKSIIKAIPHETKMPRRSPHIVHTGFCSNCGKKVMPAWKYCDDKECNEDRKNKAYDEKNRKDVIHRLSTQLSTVVGVEGARKT